MAFDMTRCPQAEDEARTWFFNGIGRQLGAPATDWENVMTNCGLPPGYGPGVIPNASMPYFAFTQQFSGGPKGRIFLPTAIPDELGYYTRCIQYLDDAQQTYSKRKNPKELLAGKSTGLVWAWYWVAGNEYAPVQGASPIGGPGNPPPVMGLLAEQVQLMIDNSIAAAIAGMTGVKFGDKIALRTNSGLLSGIKGGGPTEPDAAIEWIGKTGDPHAWESFELVKGE
jgi:hypothetical protein